MNKNHVVIIDGDNLLHRAYHRFGEFASENGKLSSMIFGAPFMVRHLITKLKPTLLYITFDGGSNKVRKNVLPNYRQRDQKLGFDYENFQEQKAIVKKLFMDLAVRVVWSEKTEADDWIYMLARKYRKHKVTIVSGDKDFHQLINETTSIYYPNKEILLTTKNLKNHFGYSPNETVDYLILRGDKSDKIPGFGGIGEKRARQFLDAAGSIKAHLDNPVPGVKVDRVKLLALYKRNRKLIDLSYFYRKYNRKNKLPILNPQPILNLPAVAKVARDYSITTLVKVDFLEGFKKLAE